MISIGVFITVISSLGLITIGVLAWIFNYVLKEKDKKISELESKIDYALEELGKIKLNYLDRFERTNINIIKTKEEIVGMLHKLHIQVAEIVERKGDINED